MIIAAVAIAAAAGYGATRLAASGDGASSGDPAHPTTRPAPAHRPPRASEGRAAPGSVVATARVHSMSVYRKPDSRSPFERLRSPNADGAPLTFLVTGKRDRRLHVQLPVRPNHSKGWISASQVTISHDPYRVRVDLRRHRITVWKGRRVIDYEPIGVGKALTPTPSGRYFITELLKPPDPRGLYGPYAFGLSAYSTVLHQFAGGNGEVGIHGTDDPAGLGTNVSHGCIRMSNAGITRLARRLPLGTAVEIAR